MTEEIRRFEECDAIPELPVGTKLYIGDQLVEVKEGGNCTGCFFENDCDGPSDMGCMRRKKEHSVFYAPITPQPEQIAEKMIGESNQGMQNAIEKLAKIAKDIENEQNKNETWNQIKYSDNRPRETKTLRDEFAMAAVTGVFPGNHYSDDAFKIMAESCYKMADAMMAERCNYGKTN